MSGGCAGRGDGGLEREGVELNLDVGRNSAHDTYLHARTKFTHEVCWTRG